MVGQARAKSLRALTSSGALRLPSHNFIMSDLLSPSELEAAVDASCKAYYDDNAKWTILGDPLTPEEKRHALSIMKSLYMVWLEQYNAGNFINAVLKNDFMEVINRADDINMRCLKLYVWFKHNEMRKSILYKNHDC